MAHKITFIKGPLYDIFLRGCKQSLNMNRSSQTVNLQKEVEFINAAMIDLLPWLMKAMQRREVMEIHKSWTSVLFSKESGAVLWGNWSKNLLLKFMRVKFTLWLNDCWSNSFFSSYYFGRSIVELTTCSIIPYLFS